MNMNDWLTENDSQLLEFLDEGELLSHPNVKRLVDKASHTLNFRVLRDYLKNHPSLVSLAWRNIHLKQLQQMQNPFRPHPSRDEVRQYLTGSINLGYVNEANDRFGFDPDILCMPMIILGRPGSGKSQCIKRQLIQMLRRNRKFNVIIPDRKGNEYRCLLPYSRTLKVIRKKRLRLNPFQVPEDMDPHEFLVFIAKVFVAENWLGLTSLGILLSILTDLFRVHGIFDGSTHYPTARDAYNEVTRRLNDQKSFKYRDILLLVQNRLIPYITNKIFDCRIGVPQEIWRTENVVMEVNGLSDNVYSFIVCHIGGLLYEYNMETGLTGAKLRNLIVSDETKPLTKPRDRETYGESYFSSDLICLSRDAGVGWELASQEPSSFNQTTKSLSYTKICFPLTDGYDRDWVKDSFTLNDLQAEYLSKLGRCGKAIATYGGFERSFLLGVAPVRLRQVSDEEVEERMADFYAGLEAKIRKAESPGPIGAIDTFPAKSVELLPPAAAALLFSLARAPFTTTSEMTNFSGFKSPAQISKALDWLLDKGYVTREEHRVSRKGRPSVFHPLTEKSYDYLDEKKVPQTKGGFLHALFAHLVATWYRAKGLEARIEAPLKKGSPKTSDVLVRNEKGEWLSVQIVLNFAGLMSNLEDLSLGASEVVIVTKNKKDEEKALALVAKVQTLTPYLDRILFRTIDTFFP